MSNKSNPNNFDHLDHLFEIKKIHTKGDDPEKGIALCKTALRREDPMHADWYLDYILAFREQAKAQLVSGFD